MNQHLNDDQIAESVIETNIEHAAHLRDCAECRTRVAHLQESLGAYGAFMREVGEHRNAYWWRQRAASPASFPLMRWAAAATVALALAFSIPFLKTTEPVTQPPGVHQMSDEALLTEVESDISREYPDAFAPVETNAESAVASKSAPAPKKEVHNK